MLDISRCVPRSRVKLSPRTIDTDRGEEARMTDSRRTRLLVLTLLCGVTELGVVVTVALVAVTPVSVGDSYWADLIRGLVLLGLAVPVLFVPIAVAALTEPTQRTAGRAVSRST